MTSETSETFTQRYIEVITLKSVDEASVTATSGIGFGVPEEVIPQLKAGQKYLLETEGFNTIGGLAEFYYSADNNQPVVARWLFHRSDQEFRENHRKMVERFQQERLESYQKHREDWARREAALPQILRERLERFRRNSPGENIGSFNVDGWGYELITSELAVLYMKSNVTDSDEVNEFAHIEGTSGNQHGFAKLLAKVMLRAEAMEDKARQEEEASIVQAPSALTPLTGNPDYSPSKA